LGLIQKRLVSKLNNVRGSTLTVIKKYILRYKIYSGTCASFIERHSIILGIVMLYLFLDHTGLDRAMKGGVGMFRCFE